MTLPFGEGDKKEVFKFSLFLVSCNRLVAACIAASTMLVGGAALVAVEGRACACGRAQAAHARPCMRQRRHACGRAAARGRAGPVQRPAGARAPPGQLPVCREEGREPASSHPPGAPHGAGLGRPSRCAASAPSPGKAERPLASLLR